MSKNEMPYVFKGFMDMPPAGACGAIPQGDKAADYQ